MTFIDLSSILQKCLILYLWLVTFSTFFFFFCSTQNDYLFAMKFPTHFPFLYRREILKTYVLFLLTGTKCFRNNGFFYLQPSKRVQSFVQLSTKWHDILSSALSISNTWKWSADVEVWWIFLARQVDWDSFQSMWPPSMFY